ncbi:hypothetical protein NDU88_006426 [Pleurodeles waltl]|uniref:Uncharacterized protein n=1 Tax=Pleurodeles waltl TaxID=8319 RepID=A0AAV7MHE8_PLEWA|nr:hypothetical protein NDU88_006426 [Pleurodeles waltl]
MYCPPHDNPPDFWSGTNAIKSTAETEHRRETTHLSTLNEEPGRHGARVTGPAHAGPPPHLPGIRKAAATSTEDVPGDGLVAAVEPVASEEEEAEEDDVDKISNIIQQYFQCHTGKTL